MVHLRGSACLPAGRFAFMRRHVIALPAPCPNPQPPTPHPHPSPLCCGRGQEFGGAVPTCEPGVVMPAAVTKREALDRWSQHTSSCKYCLGVGVWWLGAGFCGVG